MHWQPYLPGATCAHVIGDRTRPESVYMIEKKVDNYNSRNQSLQNNPRVHSTDASVKVSLVQDAPIEEDRWISCCTSPFIPSKIKIRIFSGPVHPGYVPSNLAPYLNSSLWPIDERAICHCFSTYSPNIRFNSSFVTLVEIIPYSISSNLLSLEKRWTVDLPLYVRTTIFQGAKDLKRASALMM